ncbi:hypothetical protein TRVA0_012S00364 [Trichomonascus vanleenenianus]|uniref:putative peptide hydrolase n=1 Tax=Trichomonascus vanleenenianus TaxID=2268995 RepID=UPI003ECBA52A
MGNIGYTFNCRADSLANNSKMWNAPKQRQRCIVLAQGYFEWKKTDNKKIPHYIKRKDGKLMLLAGLWDVNKHIDKEGLYTYTVVTTDAHKGMEWLHSRMPVILDEADTEAINKWLDPKYVWNQHSSELLAMLKPFDSSRLDIYQVSSDVGKLSNDYEGLTKPLKESKRLITSFFGGKSKGDKVKEDKSGLKKEPIKEEEDEVENGEEQRGSLKEERDEVKDEEEQKASVKKQGEQRDSVKEETAAADKSELSQSPPRKREPPRPAPSPKKKQRKLDDNQKSITSFFS